MPPKRKRLRFSKYFRQFKIRKKSFLSTLYRRGYDVATQMLFYTRLQDVANQTSSRRRKSDVVKTS